MELKYHVGDKVVIRPDLKIGEVYKMYSGPMHGRHTYNIVPSMKQLAGKFATIESVCDGGAGYRLEEYGFSWTDGMLLPADLNECVCASLL